MPGPLDGYRVVEISEGVAGPYTAMSLGDAGADVIKIESAVGRPSAQLVRRRRRAELRRPVSGPQSQQAMCHRPRLVVATPPILTRPCAATAPPGADVAIVDKVGLPPDALSWDSLDARPASSTAHISGFGPHASSGTTGRGFGELAAHSWPANRRRRSESIGEEPVRLRAGTLARCMPPTTRSRAICAALYARDDSDPSAPTGGQRVEVSLFGSLLAMRSTLWVALSNPDEWWGFHLDSYIKPPDHGYQCRRPAHLLLAGANQCRDAL